MAEITVTDRDGGVHRVNAREGVSLMETLRELDYGVAAICGGMCSCATCHVYVAEPWIDQLPPMQGDEKEILQELESYRPRGSRRKNKVKGCVPFIFVPPGPRLSAPRPRSRPGPRESGAAPPAASGRRARTGSVRRSGC
jgi:2Fe-2S ferredoxin